MRKEAKRLYREQLGPYASAMLELTMQKPRDKQQQYSVSMISAITQDSVLANQIIEGSVDSVLFENFVYQTLLSVRKDPATASKEVVLFMDNAVIHKHSAVLETARRLKVNVLFNAEYSPWLNPVEQLFGHVKRQLRDHQVSTK